MSEETIISTAVGHIPSGLFIVCAQDESSKEIDGFLASWVQQVSFEPLLISLAVKPGRPCADHILEKKRFTINIVGDHEKEYLRHFWTGYDPDKNPFAEIDHEVSEEGDVALKQAKSTITAQAVEINKPGDHNLIIARVIKSEVHNTEVKSMVHQRKDGMSY